jgi:FkbM family methyltransferase
VSVTAVLDRGFEQDKTIESVSFTTARGLQLVLARQKNLVMADVIKQVRLGGREWRIQGDDQDLYLSWLQGCADGMTGLIAAARRHVAPDATILDIGANLGLATLALSEVVPDGQVIAFEPGPTTVRHLTANLTLNSVSNCTVVPVAAGSRAGVVHFETVPTFAAGAHVLQASHATARGAAIDVPVVALDDWLSDAGVRRVDFMKVDAEGYEPWVLDGAHRVITRDRPPIFMEFNSWCLLAFADVNPVVFSRGLWRAFQISAPEPAGQRELPDPLVFAHDNLVRHGSVQDVLLELRDGQSAPRLDELMGEVASSHSLQ